uniref:Secreted protein n=1 Tax=Heterorhabditis bacteriophora TaxID=37862 RepID=A0A1I7XPJ6_HETBA
MMDAMGTFFQIRACVRCMLSQPRISRNTRIDCGRGLKRKAEVSENPNSVPKWIDNSDKLFLALILCCQRQILLKDWDFQTNVLHLRFMQTVFSRKVVIRLRSSLFTIHFMSTFFQRDLKIFHCSSRHFALFKYNIGIV